MRGRLIKTTGILMALCLGLSLPGCVLFVANHLNVSDLSSVDMTQEFVTGEACSSTFLLFVRWGNSTITEAARSGGVQYIDYVETDFEHLIFFLTRTCTKVYGHNSP